MKKRIVLFLLALLLVCQCGVAYAADGTSYVFQGYTYDFFGNDKSTPAPFLLSRVFDASNLSGIALDSVDDVCTSKDGRIFIVDSKQSRVHVLDENGKMLKTLKTIRDADNKIVINEDGSQLVLNGCQGCFYHEKNQELYIADTGAQRVVVLDGETYAHKRTINKPADMTGVTEFKPAKVVVDTADRIYLVVLSSFEGIIELNEDGSFSRYFGVNEPIVNLVDFMWKSIATDAQKQKMGKTYAPAFNNIALDGEGFVMAVSSDAASNKMVFRLNSQGKNVLREMGSTPVQGDLINRDGKTSAFVDIAVTPYGTYAVVDKSHGRVFIYSFDGDLLSAFGSLGNVEGQLKNPSAIAWLGDKLLVADSTLRVVYVLEPTAFGSALLRAEESYYAGRWDEATEHYQEVLRLCGNLDVAYGGIGKNYLMKEEYDDAMYYFKLGHYHTYYSEAYQGHRSNQLRDHFGIVAVIAVVLVGLVIGSEIRYHRKERRARG